MSRAVVLLALLLAAGPASGRAQDAAPAGGRGRPDVLEELTLGGVNAVLGGLTAGLLRKLNGGEFRPAFARGLAGGAFVYAGKRVAVEPFDGAGLLGRNVAAVGTSIVRNAGEGRSVLAEIVLPVGPARIYLSRDTVARLRIRVKADLPTLLAAGYVALEPDTDLDWGASLSAGTPIFETRRGSSACCWTGFQAAGVIWLRDDEPGAHELALAREAVRAHEQVHVLQYDFGLHTWSAPVDAWLTTRVPGGSWIERYFDVGTFVAGWALANQLLPYGQRPWEREAFVLTGSRPGDD